MQRSKWVACSFLLLALLAGYHSDVVAQKPAASSQLDLVPDERAEFYRFDNMRVDKESGAPVALYRVNYAVSPSTPLDMARQYLQENSALLRLRADISELQHTSTRETPGGYHVRFLQQLGGYPVYGGDIVVTIDRQNRVNFVMNSTKPLAKLVDTTPLVSLDEAERIAERYLDVQGRIHFRSKNTVVYYNKGVTRLAHRIMTVPSEDMFGEWEVLVDAASGEVFRAENKAVHATGSGWVFHPDPLTRGGATYQTGGQFGDNNDADTDSLTAQLIRRDLLDLEFDGSYHLRGPYAQIVDSESPFNGLFSRADSAWHFTRNPSDFEAANVYFHLDRSMRYINETLGFSLMPYQYSGGVKGDPHGLGGDDNSHYISSTGELAWGEGGVDDSEDEDVILHELGHGLHDWLTGGSLSQVEGLSEGCGDYWANSYNRATGFWTPSDPQYYWVFQWDGHNEYWAGRVTNYAATYPGGLVGQIHTDGQIWASTLMQIWDDIGRTATDLNFLEALSMTNGATNQEDAAQAFVQADLNNHGGANLGAIEYWFTQRGYSITVPTPSITHTPLPDTEDVAGPYTVDVTVVAAFALESVKLIHGIGGAFTDTLDMVFQAGDDYSASIPGTGVATDYNYYILAADTAGLASTHPVGAPGSFHAFSAGPDTIAPVIVHAPLGDQAYIQWPADVSATITDELGVGSAWVEYSVNNGALTGSFTMANTTGDIWAGTFDIDTTMVAIGDSVEYRIVAEDASVGANQVIDPLLGYHDFKIIGILGTVLIIDDDPTSKSAVVNSEKGAHVRNLAQNPYGQSANVMQTYLNDAGYAATVETPATTNPVTWDNYDLIISSSGINESSFGDATYRNALIAHAQAGKKYIVEGGEVGWTWRNNAPMMSDVLHSSSWNGDNSGALKRIEGQAGHPIITTPTLLPSTIAITYTAYGSEDAMTPTDSYVIYETTLDPGDAGVGVYDDNADSTSAQSVYYAFNFSQITDVAVARAMLENTVAYLLTPEGVNAPPVVASAMPDTTIEENSATIENYRDLNDVFVDAEDGSSLAFSIESNSNPTLITATIDPDSALDLSVAPSETGSATIVVRATDTGLLAVEDTLVVTVTPAGFVLTAVAVGGGAVVRTPNQATYLNGDTVVVEAIPDGGWVFDGWSGGLGGTVNPDTIVMASDTSITATFSPDSFLVTVTTIPVGLEVVVDSVAYAGPRVFTSAFGTSHEILVNSPQASGDTVYVFTSWSDGDSIVHNITVPDSSATYTASFDAYLAYATIDSIVDVPADQGGDVGIHITRSWYDSVDELVYPIAQYKVWRRAESGGSGKRGEIQRVDFQGGTWAVIDSFPASQQDHYVHVAPTLGDSSDTALPITAYAVSAHVDTVWFLSPADSGYSVDNIFPATPDTFAVAYNTGSGNHLTWAASTDPDLRHFRIYRSTDPNFTPTPGDLVDSTTATAWFDAEFDGWQVYYRATAVDDAGNESDPAIDTTPTAIAGTAVPTKLALYQNAPNPFNPTTVIRYDVPAGGARVTLAIYDVGGRLVRSFVDGEVSEGRKSARWDGTDARGNNVSSGIYFYRLTAGSDVITRKMVLVK